MNVLAIDPGSEQSAWLHWSGGKVVGFGITPNADLLVQLRHTMRTANVAVIEKVESYGMPVGREVFDTVHWSGRFAEALHPMLVVQMPRRAVKLFLCGTVKANDASIRAALIDMFGGVKSAKGTKAAPGPLYGVSKDVWSALAIAVTYDHSTKESKPL